MHGRTLLKSAAVIVAAIGASASAAPVNVPNHSFESPSAATPFGVSTKIDNWTTYGDFPFDTGGGANSSGTGIFPNTNPDSSINFSNAHLNQVAFIFTKSSIPGNTDGLEQILPSTFEAGKAYEMLIDVGLAGANPGATEPFTFALFYLDPGNPTARNKVAARTIYNDANTPLSKTILTELNVISPILDASHPAVGKQIGVEIFTATPADVSAIAGRQYDFDNVRVNDGVPEPGALSALTAAALCLSRRRRRE